MKQIYLFPVFIISTLGIGLSGNTLPKVTEHKLSVRVEQSEAVQDTTKVQYVRESEPKGKKSKAPKVKTTRVNFTREVQRASLSKQSNDGNQVDIIVMQSGQIIRNLEDLQMVGSSGNQLNNNKFIGFENITVPFEGSIRFKATNRLGTATYDREVRFTVMEDGKWLLKVDL